MSTIYTLQEVARSHGLSPDGVAFCRALLVEGEVLALRLSYFPESLVWLVTTRSQARLMRTQAAGALIMTLAEAQDLLCAAGSTWPATLWEVAASLVAPAPGAPEPPAEPRPNEPDTEDGWPVL
jgi:hypothetical protein